MFTVGEERGTKDIVSRFGETMLGIFFFPTSTLANGRYYKFDSRMSTKACQEPITSIQAELTAIHCNVCACLANTDA